MRLIDADALIKSLDDAIQDAKRKNEIGDYWEDDRSNLLYYLDNAPTIDAVEVVRCKDCKDIFFDDWYKCFSCANLYGLNEEVKPDDFCSHGERKESE